MTLTLNDYRLPLLVSSATVYADKYSVLSAAGLHVVALPPKKIKILQL